MVKAPLFILIPLLVLASFTPAKATELAEKKEQQESNSQLETPAERWFEVELYIFTRETPHQLEALPDTVNLPSTIGAVDLIKPRFATNITEASLKGVDDCNWLNPSSTCEHQFSQSNELTLPFIPVEINTEEFQYGVTDGPAVLLSKEQQQFSELIATLTDKLEHTPLLHMSWQQAMLPQRTAKPIRLYSGKDLSHSFEKNGQAVDSDSSESQIPQFDFSTLFDNEQSSSPVWQLDGLLTIYLEHYLFIETELVLRVEGEKAIKLPLSSSYTPINISSEIETTATENKPTVPFLYAFPMSQKKRVRSDEIHYFDHPQMGMIIQIRKMVHPDEFKEQISNSASVVDNSF